MAEQRMWPVLRSLLLAAGFVAIAALLRVWPLSSLGTQLLWMTFYPAVVVSAVIGGLWVGEFAVGLSVLVAIFLGPLLVGEAFVSTSEERLGLVVFTVTASFICLVAELMRRAQAKAVVEAAARSEAEATATALRQVTEQLQSAQRIGHVGSWTLELASGVVTWTDELFLMQGLNPKDPVPDFAQQERMNTPDSWQRLNAAVARTQETGEPYELELEVLRPDGSSIWMLTRGEAVRNPKGGISGVRGVALDITERKQAALALAASQESLRVVLDTSLDPTLRLGRDMRVEYVNRRMVEISGIPFEEWIGKSHLELGYPADLLRVWDRYNQQVLATGESVTYEFEIDNAGSLQWFETSLAPEFDRDGSVAHIVATSREVTDRKATEEALLALATHDPLTGLANRATLLDEIDRALGAHRRSGRATALLMLDLDHFKDINDTLGHTAGDSLLIAVARRLETFVRVGDLVARLGGDEFVVAMRDLDDPAEAVRAANRLVDAFRAPFTPGGVERFATASIGVSIVTDTTQPGTTEPGDAGDLLREADTAMYAAKGAGRDRVAVFNDDLRAAVTTRMAVEANLRHALERGQLAVWYQPEVDLVTGEVTAVEALLRWHHPDGTLWTADRFIDVAEDSGLILDIGDWVLRQACVQGAAWATARPDRPLTVRVNASALQLAEAGLLPAIDDALSASGLDPGLLCIEITETALLRQSVTATSNLAGIHDRGIALAIDDFGTGYASLTYLRLYPIDVIKIDRSFITDPTPLPCSWPLSGGSWLLGPA